VAAPSTIIDRKTPDPAGSAGLHLVVMGPDEFATHPLPAAGEIVIGRGAGVEVSLADPLASRRHARLRVGPTLEVEDLGSANGTRLREAPLPPRQAARVLPGEAIAIGSTILMIQQNRARPLPRAILPHAEFEGRIDWECARAEATGATFSLVRLKLSRADGAALAASAAEVLRPIDLLGAYGPAEYEVLLPGLGPEAAASVARALARAVGARTRTGIAAYPADGRHAGALVARANARLRGEGDESGDEGAEALDEEMRRVHALAARAAAGSINLLILGETGAGKEVLARRVHRLSPRAARPFVCINCAALSEPLLESELFGHERGAFTGATAAKPGLLETAPGGTVFLDEVGELPAALQAKLLRVIETRELTRVGSVRSRQIDVRFIAATNRDLEAEVARGGFRRDLYFRLNGMTLSLPPLRERPGEIPALCRLFLKELSPAAGRKQPPRLTAEALAQLCAHAWPGNVRELRNAIERALLLAPGDEIGVEHLPGAAPVAVVGERERILAALAACAGNQSRAARQLGISRKVLLARLDSYGVKRPRKGER
jgi:two-component system response regulator AtoC